MGHPCGLPKPPPPVRYRPFRPHDGLAATNPRATISPEPPIDTEPPITMNILHVTQSLDPSWGGIARVLPMLAGEFATAGDTCRIAVLHGDRFGDAPDVPGVEVLKFHPRKGCRLGRSADFDKRIGELVASADVLHLHGLWTGQNWSAASAARKVGRRVLAPKTAPKGRRNVSF